jgi:hypothetical protein
MIQSTCRAFHSGRCGSDTGSGGSRTTFSTSTDAVASDPRRQSSPAASPSATRRCGRTCRGDRGRAGAPQRSAERAAGSPCLSRARIEPGQDRPGQAADAIALGNAPDALLQRIRTEESRAKAIQVETMRRGTRRRSWLKSGPWRPTLLARWLEAWDRRGRCSARWSRSRYAARPS